MVHRTHYWLTQTIIVSFALFWTRFRTCYALPIPEKQVQDEENSSVVLVFLLDHLPWVVTLLILILFFVIIICCNCRTIRRVKKELKQITTISEKVEMSDLLTSPPTNVDVREPQNDIIDILENSGARVYGNRTKVYVMCSGGAEDMGKSKINVVLQDHADKLGEPIDQSQSGNTKSGNEKYANENPTNQDQQINPTSNANKHSKSNSGAIFEIKPKIENGNKKHRNSVKTLQALARKVLKSEPEAETTIPVPEKPKRSFLYSAKEDTKNNDDDQEEIIRKQSVRLLETFEEISETLTNYIQSVVEHLDVEVIDIVEQNVNTIIQESTNYIENRTEHITNIEEFTTNVSNTIEDQEIITRNVFERNETIELENLKILTKPMGEDLQCAKHEDKEVQCDLIQSELSTFVKTGKINKNDSNFPDHESIWKTNSGVGLNSGETHLATADSEGFLTRGSKPENMLKASKKTGDFMCDLEQETIDNMQGLHFQKLPQELQNRPIRDAIKKKVPVAENEYNYEDRKRNEDFICDLEEPTIDNIQGLHPDTQHFQDLPQELQNAPIHDAIKKGAPDAKSESKYEDLKQTELTESVESGKLHEEPKDHINENSDVTHDTVASFDQLTRAQNIPQNKSNAQSENLMTHPPSVQKASNISKNTKEKPILRTNKTGDEPNQTDPNTPAKPIPFFSKLFSAKKAVSKFSKDVPGKTEHPDFTPPPNAVEHLNADAKIHKQLPPEVESPSDFRNDSSARQKSPVLKIPDGFSDGNKDPGNSWPQHLQELPQKFQNTPIHDAIKKGAPVSENESKYEDPKQTELAESRKLYEEPQDHLNENSDVTLGTVASFDQNIPQNKSNAQSENLMTNPPSFQKTSNISKNTEEKPILYTNENGEANQTDPNTPAEPTRFFSKLFSAKKAVGKFTKRAGVADKSENPDFTLAPNSVEHLNAAAKIQKIDKQLSPEVEKPSDFRNASNGRQKSPILETPDGITNGNNDSGNSWTPNERQLPVGSSGDDYGGKVTGDTADQSLSNSRGNENVELSSAQPLRLEISFSNEIPGIAVQKNVPLNVSENAAGFFKCAENENNPGTVSPFPHVNLSSIEAANKLEHAIENFDKICDDVNDVNRSAHSNHPKMEKPKTESKSLILDRSTKLPEDGDFVIDKNQFSVIQDSNSCTPSKEERSGSVAADKANITLKPEYLEVENNTENVNFLQEEIKPVKIQQNFELESPPIQFKKTKGNVDNVDGQPGNEVADNCFVTPVKNNILDSSPHILHAPKPIQFAELAASDAKSQNANTKIKSANNELKPESVPLEDESSKGNGEFKPTALDLDYVFEPRPKQFGKGEGNLLIGGDNQEENPNITATNVVIAAQNNDHSLEPGQNALNGMANNNRNFEMVNKYEEANDLGKHEITLDPEIKAQHSTAEFQAGNNNFESNTLHGEPKKIQKQDSNLKVNAQPETSNGYEEKYNNSESNPETKSPNVNAKQDVDFKTNLKQNTSSDIENSGVKSNISLEPDTQKENAKSNINSEIRADKPSNEFETRGNNIKINTDYGEPTIFGKPDVGSETNPKPDSQKGIEKPDNHSEMSNEFEMRNNNTLMTNAENGGKKEFGKNNNFETNAKHGTSNEVDISSEQFPPNAVLNTKAKNDLESNSGDVINDSIADHSTENYPDKIGEGEAVENQSELLSAANQDNNTNLDDFNKVPRESEEPETEPALPVADSSIQSPQVPPAIRPQVLRIRQSQSDGRPQTNLTLALFQCNQRIGLNFL